jgi:hypothetical protein
VRSQLAPFQELDGPAQERRGLVRRQTMLKDHGHDLFNDGVIRVGEALLWWDVRRGSGARFGWGIFRFKSFARVIISAWVFTHFLFE